MSTVILKRKAPANHDGDIIADANTARGYFSVTGEISTGRERKRGDAQICGCIHEEITRSFPQLKPLISLHLSDAETGEPLHAEANGIYWLAGACGGLGEAHHGGNGHYSRTPEDCLQLFADHFRVTTKRAKEIAEQVREAFDRGGPDEARSVFREACNAQRETWAAEAAAGRALLDSLAEANQ